MDSESAEVACANRTSASSNLSSLRALASSLIVSPVGRGSLVLRNKEIFGMRSGVKAICLGGREGLGLGLDMLVRLLL